jgi:outer membrane protein assembly factor BamB
MGATFGIHLRLFTPPEGRGVGPRPYAWRQYGHGSRRRPVFEKAQNPSQSWTYQVDTVGIASPASVVGGVVYAGSNGNRVVAVKDGVRLWQVRVPNQVMTTPLVIGPRIIVGVGNKSFTTARVRGTGWSGVMALRRLTGSTLWRVRTSGEAMPTPAFNSRRVYAATGDGKLVVISIRRGHVLANIGLHGSYVSMSSPLLVGHRLYVGGAAPYALYALDVSTDRLLWSRPLPAQGGLDDCSPAWAAGLIATQYTNYLNKSQTKLSATMVAITPKGRVAWSTSLGTGTTDADEMQTGQPTVVGNQIYVGSPVTDNVYKLDARTGRILWETNVGAAVRGNPAVVDGKVLVGDSLGRLDTLSQQSGDLIRTTGLTPAKKSPSGMAPTPSGFSGSGPVIVGQTLYITSMNGTIIARPLRNFL